MNRNFLRKELETVLDILDCDVDSIKQLARKSQRPLFHFFKGADLTNLDLSGEDLTGLNFDDASFKGSKLDNIVFDRGAFNNSVLSPEIAEFVDEYDVYLDDLLNHFDDFFYVFVRFRADELDRELKVLGFSNILLSNLSNVSVTTIRKARRGGVVSLNTAKSIADALINGGEKDIGENLLLRLPPIERQPYIQLLELNPTGGFEWRTRKDIISLSEGVANDDKSYMSSLGRWSPALLRIRALANS